MNSMDIQSEDSVETSLLSEKEMKDKTSTISSEDMDIITCILKDCMFLRDKEHQYTEKHIKLYNLYYNDGLRMVTSIISMIYLALILFEDNYFHFSYDIKYILYVLEMICILYFGLTMFLYYFLYESKIFWKGFWNKTCIVILLWSLVDLNVYTFWGSIPRYSRAFRPILVLSRFRNLRHLFTSFGKSLSKSYSTLFLLFLVVILWGFLGHLLFTNWNNPPEYPGPHCSVFLQNDCKDFFSNPFEAVWQVYTLLSTVNFPDVMLPYLNNNNSILPQFLSNTVTSLYFVIYIWIVLFVIFKLMYAIMFAAYQNYNEYIFNKKLERNLFKYQQVFKILKKNSSYAYIAYEDWKAVFHAVRPDLSDEILDIFYNASILDSISKTSFMLEKEFIESCEYLTVRVKEYRHEKSIIEIFTKGHELISNFMKKIKLYNLLHHCNINFIRQYYNSSISITITNLLIYIQMILVLFQINFNSSIPLCDVMISTIYIISILDKVLSLLFMNPDNLYNTFTFHILDLLCLLLTCVSYYIIEPLCHFDIYDINLRGTWISNLLILFRIIRILVPIYTVINPYWSILRVVGTLFKRSLAILFSIFYIFAVIGYNIYAYKLVSSNINVQNSSYGQNDFYTMNFDDVIHSFTTIFYMLVVNNWPIIAEGCEAAIGPWSRVYFVLFYIIANIIFMNCISAFIVNTMFVLISYKLSVEHGMKENWQKKIDIILDKYQLNHKYYCYKKLRTFEIITIYIKNK